VLLRDRTDSRLQEHSAAFITRSCRVRRDILENRFVPGLLEGASPEDNVVLFFDQQLIDFWLQNTV
jgi:hypothetical protein